MPMSGGAPSSRALKVALPLPGRHGAVEALLLDAEEVGVVGDDLLAEGLAQHLALLHLAAGGMQGRRRLLDVRRTVGITTEQRRRLGAVGDAIEAGGNARRDRQVGVGVG